MIKLSKILSELDLDSGGGRVLIIKGFGSSGIKEPYYKDGTFYGIIQEVTQEQISKDIEKFHPEEIPDLIEDYKEWGRIVMNKEETIGASVLGEEGDSIYFISIEDRRYVKEGSDIDEYDGLIGELNFALNDNDIIILPLPIPEEYLDND